MLGRSLLLTLLLVNPVLAQDFRLIRTDGVQIDGKLVGWTDGKVRIGGATEASDRVLFFHGPAARVRRTAGMIVHLANGDVVAGPADLAIPHRPTGP